MTTLSHECMMQQMLTHQNELNSIINPEWKSANYPWHTAIWTECAELMDHIGWKWWAKQVRNDEQVRLEVADIWHFILSWNYQRGLIPTLYPVESAGDIAHAVAGIAHHATNGWLDGVEECFAVTCAVLGITLDDLYKLHTGKYVLNKFRQLHGYKEGTYNKAWYGGREDNEVLHEILNTCGAPSEDFELYVHSALSHAYAQTAECAHCSEFMSL